jgi:hypothetical protein
MFTAILRALSYDQSVPYLLDASATVIGKSVMAGLAGELAGANKGPSGGGTTVLEKSTGGKH